MTRDDNTKEQVYYTHSLCIAQMSEKCKLRWFEYIIRSLEGEENEAHLRRSSRKIILYWNINNNFITFFFCPTTIIYVVRF